MKTHAFALLGLLPIVTAAHGAENPLVGTWEVSRIECESGTPVQNPQGILNTIRGDFTFTEKTYAMTWDYDVKITPEYAAKAIRDLNSERPELEQLPDVPGKQASLDQLDASIALTKRYVRGVHCGLETGGAYRVSGDSVELTEASYSQINDVACGGTGDGGSNSISTAALVIADRFALRGGTLKLYSKDPAQSSDACPLADTVVVLTRKK